MTNPFRPQAASTNNPFRRMVTQEDLEHQERKKRAVEEEQIRAERGAKDGVLPAVVTTAKAPGPFERALARGVMESGTTNPAFGREEDLTPLARQQFQRAAAARAIAEDIGKAAFGQPARTATRTVTGAAKLVGLPSAGLERTMRAVEEQTAPTTGPGAVVRAGTEIGAMLPGGLALGASRAALEASAGESSVNAILEAMGRKPIESPVGRALAEVGLDVAALGLGQAVKAGTRARPRTPTPRAPESERLALPAGPIRDRSRLLGPGPDAPMQGPAIPMGGAVMEPLQGPGIPMGGPRQLFLPRPPRATEGPQILGPGIPMPGVPDPSRITDPSRLLPESVPNDVTRQAVQARWQTEFFGPPPKTLTPQARRPKMTAPKARRGFIDPEALIPAGTGAAGAIAGATTTPEDEPGSIVGRAMAGALAGVGAGRLGMRGIKRLGTRGAEAAADVAAPIARALDETPPAARGVPEVDVRTPERPTTTGRVPEERLGRAAERITEPSRPYPKDARYVPRTDDEWREFYGRFMTNPQEIAEVDALRQAGTVQTRQGTRRAADDARLAQTMAETFDDLALREAGRKLSGPELVALRAQREANAARRVALSERLADPTLSPADREWMTELNRSLEDTMLAQFERYTRDVSQTGRDLRMLQEVARLSEDPADWLLRAERLAGGKPLTPEQIQELNLAIGAKDFARASRVVGAARQYGLADRLGELWQTGLLTSVARPLRDAVGNMVNLGDKQLERVVATGVDRMFGMATGVRTADYSVRQSSQLLNESARRGGESAMAILRGKGDPAVLERVMKRYDMERESMQRHPWLRAYTGFIKRTIGAADALVYDVALTSALGEQARVLARQTAKEGTPAFEQLVRGYLEAPPPEMFGIAASQAAEVTWQNSTTLGELAQSIRRVQRPELRLLGKLVVPFVQTPSSMATQTMRGTPLGMLGGAKDVVEMARKTNLPEAQRRLVNRIAKTTVGGGWIALGYTLADDDKMTSWYPDDDRERRRWELEGRTEAAVKIGGTWVSLLGVLGPQAQLMTIGAAMRKMTEDPKWVQRTFLDQMSRGLATTATGAARSTLDSPMLQGMRTVQEVGQQVARGDTEGLGEAGSKVAQTFVGGMVPQVVQQIARARDVTEEGTVRVRQPLVPGDPMQTAINAVLQGIPFARQTVPVRRGALGEERATSVGGLAGVFSPARLSQETSDPRAQELWRTGAAVPRTTQRRGESEADYTARQQALGAATKAVVAGVMADPRYQAISQMPVSELRQALATQLAARGGGDLPEMSTLQALSDDEVRRRYQGLILDMAIQRARTQAGAGFADPRGGAAGNILQSMTRR